MHTTIGLGAFQMGTHAHIPIPPPLPPPHSFLDSFLSSPHFSLSLSSFIPSSLLSLLPFLLPPSLFHPSSLLPSSPSFHRLPLSHCRSVEGGLRYKFFSSWAQVLRVLGTFYRVAGRQCRGFMSKVLTQTEVSCHGSMCTTFQNSQI